MNTSNPSFWFTAARTGDSRYILQHKHEFQRQTDVQFPHSTALILASLSNHTDTAKILIPAERSMQNRHGWCALHFAAFNGNVELCKLLIPFENALRTKQQFRNIPPGATAEQIAAICGQYEVSKLFSSQYAYLYNDNCTIPMARDSLGRTALHYLALSNRNLASMQQVLSQLIQQTDNQGLTALMLAAQAGNIQAVQFLVPLESGMQESLQGNTALILAVQNQQNAVISLLLDNESRMQNYVGLTALMLAAKTGNLAAVNLLINEKGMQTTKKFNQFEAGTTALMFAQFYGKKECVYALEQYESSIVNVVGQTYQAIDKLTLNSVRQNSPMRAQQSALSGSQYNSQQLNPEMLSLLRSQTQQQTAQYDLQILSPNSEIGQLSEQLRETQKELTVVSTRLEERDKYVQQLSQLVIEKKCEGCVQKDAKIADYEKECQKHKLVAEAREHEATDLRRRVEELRTQGAQIEHLEAQLREIYKVIVGDSAVPASHDSEVQQLKEEAQKLIDQVETLKRQNSDQEEQIARLKQPSSDAAAQQLRDENDALKTENANLKSEIQQIMAQTPLPEDLPEHTPADAKTEQFIAGEQENRIASLQQELAEKNTVIEQQRVKITEADRKNQYLQEQLENSQNAVPEGQIVQQAAQGEKEAAYEIPLSQKQIQHYESEISALRKQIENAGFISMLKKENSYVKNTVNEQQRLRIEQLLQEIKLLKEQESQIKQGTGLSAGQASNAEDPDAAQRAALYEQQIASLKQQLENAGFISLIKEENRATKDEIIQEQSQKILELQAELLLAQQQTQPLDEQKAEPQLVNAQAVDAPTSGDSLELLRQKLRQEEDENIVILATSKKQCTQLENAQSEISRLQQKIQDIAEQLGEHKGVVARPTEDAAQSEQQNELATKLREYEQIKDAQSQQISELKDAFEDAKSQLQQQIDSNDSLNQLYQQISAQNEELKRSAEQQEEANQILKAQIVAKQAEISELDEKLLQTQQSCDELSQQAAQLREAAKAAEEQLLEVEAKNSESDRLCQQLVAQNEEILARQVEQQQKNQAANEKVVQQQAEIEQLARERDTLRKDAIDAQEKAQAELAQKEAKCKQLRAVQEKNVQVLSRCGQVVDQLRDQIAQQLAETAQAMADQQQEQEVADDVCAKLQEAGEPVNCYLHEEEDAEGKESQEQAPARTNVKKSSSQQFSNSQNEVIDIKKCASLEEPAEEELVKEFMENRSAEQQFSTANDGKAWLKSQVMSNQVSQILPEEVIQEQIQAEIAKEEQESEKDQPHAEEEQQVEVQEMENQDNVQAEQQTVQQQPVEQQPAQEEQQFEVPQQGQLVENQQEENQVEMVPEQVQQQTVQEDVQEAGQVEVQQEQQLENENPMPEDLDSQQVEQQKQVDEDQLVQPTFYYETTQNNYITDEDGNQRQPEEAPRNPE